MATLAILNKKKLNAKATKEKKVDEIAAIAKTAKVVAVISLRNLPDKQLQAFRKKLRGKATIMIAKNSVITRALAKAGKASELTTTMTTPSAVLFTDIDPFALYKTIVQSKGKAAAKPGQIAPFDLIVPKGETSFPPGPILTE